MYISNISLFYVITISARREEEFHNFSISGTLNGQGKTSEQIFIEALEEAKKKFEETSPGICLDKLVINFYHIEEN